MAKKEYKVQASGEKTIYEPPEQSGAGQIFDSIFLLIIIYLVLLFPLALGLTAGNTKTELPQTITWETLGQNQVMQAQWKQLGLGPKEAAEYICTRFVTKSLRFPLSSRHRDHRLLFSRAAPVRQGVPGGRQRALRL